MQQEAMRIAKGTQKKGQTKEQTKLVAQGIEKGISEYKKQQKIKSRERDKQRKKSLLAKVNVVETAELTTQSSESKETAKNSTLAIFFPWMLLALSWGYFLFTSS